MQTTKKNEQVGKLALMALLTALVAVLSYLGGFIKIGPASINLTLIPVVLGAAMCGPLWGAWLGAVSAGVFFATVDAAFWLGLSVPGTIVTVMLKGILAGLFAGLVYKLLEKVNKYFAVVVSAIVCPVVNTGIFLLGCRIFFMDTIRSWATDSGMPIGTYIIVGMVGINFVAELLANVIVSPGLYRLLNIKKKA